jgi:hypothetical protein
MAGGPLALGMMVAGQMVGAMGEHDGLRAGAKADEANANRAELEGALEAEAIARAERAASGEALAAVGANRAGVGTGSALDLLRQNAIEREYSILSRRYSASTEAAGLRAAAAQKRQAAKFALFGGAMRAGAQALTGMSDARGAAQLAKSNAAVRASRLPGGQKLPVPARLVPQSDTGWSDRMGAPGWLTPTVFGRN